jgi:hypothetical protein
MSTEHQHAARHEDGLEAAQDLPLHAILKVREREVAAQYQVKRPIGYFPPDVLAQEGNGRAVRGTQLEGVADALKGLDSPRRGEIP